MYINGISRVLFDGTRYPEIIADCEEHSFYVKPMTRFGNKLFSGPSKKCGIIRYQSVRIHNNCYTGS